MGFNVHVSYWNLSIIYCFKTYVSLYENVSILCNWQFFHPIWNSFLFLISKSLCIVVEKFTSARTHGIQKTNVAKENSWINSFLLKLKRFKIKSSICSQILNVECDGFSRMPLSIFLFVYFICTFVANARGVSDRKHLVVPCLIWFSFCLCLVHFWLRFI